VDVVHPSAAITKVMGLPQADRPQLWNWTKMLISAADELHGNLDAGVVIADFMSYIGHELAQRRSAGSDIDDAIGRVLSFVDPNGEDVSDAEVALHVVTLLLAGNDTTAHLLANLVRRLAEDSESYQTVARRPIADPAGDRGVASARSAATRLSSALLRGYDRR
jgi:cholest-4-en-3-one 26-monooxygenase